MMTVVILTRHIYFFVKSLVSLEAFSMKVPLKTFLVVENITFFLVRKFFLHYKICPKIIPLKFPKSVRKYFRQNFIRQNFWVLM